MYRKKYPQPGCIFFGGKILQDLKKTCKKEDFLFKMSLSKCLHRSNTIFSHRHVTRSYSYCSGI